MKIINGLWVFYKKLVIPSAALSVCLGLMMGMGMNVIGMAGYYKGVLQKTTSHKSAGTLISQATSS